MEHILEKGVLTTRDHVAYSQITEGPSAPVSQCAGGILNSAEQLMATRAAAHLVLSRRFSARRAFVESVLIHAAQSISRATERFTVESV
jgi:hypothetical protein